MPQSGLVNGRSFIRSMGAAYSRSQSKITKTLLTVDPLSFSIKDVPRIITPIKKEVALLDSEAAAQAARFVSYGYSFGKRNAVTTLRALGREKNPEANPLKESEDKRDKLSETLAYLYKANRSILATANSYLFIVSQISTQISRLREFAGIQGVSDEEEQYLLGYIGDAVAEGESRQAVARGIRDYLGKRVGEGNLIVVNGRRYKMKYYAEMVARTEMRAAQSMAVLTSCREYGNDLVEVSDHGTTTEICKPFEGNVYSISGTDGTYPHLFEAPPFHPNCQHFIVPTSQEAIDYFKKAA